MRKFLRVGCLVDAVTEERVVDAAWIEKLLPVGYGRSHLRAMLDRMEPGVAFKLKDIWFLSIASGVNLDQVDWEQWG